MPVTHLDSENVCQPCTASEGLPWGRNPPIKHSPTNLITRPRMVFPPPQEAIEAFNSSIEKSKNIHQIEKQQPTAWMETKSGIPGRRPAVQIGGNSENQDWDAAQRDDQQQSGRHVVRHHHG